MKTIKILCALLAVLMIVASFAACNTDKDPDGGNDEAVSSGASDADSGSEIFAADKALDDLLARGYDFENEFPEFSMLVLDREMPNYKVESGETGIHLEDAVFLRNTTFEETFKVKLNVVSVEQSAIRSALSNDVSTDGYYDVIMDQSDHAIPYAQTGLLYNYLDLENLNLDASWWDQGTRGFEIANSLFFMDGSYNYSDENMTYCLMFNKKMYEDRKHTFDKSFYDSVHDNEWTLDYFAKVTQGVATDLNGDKVYDERDTYGFVTTDGYGVSFFYGSGLCFTTFPADDDPFIDVGENMIEKSASVLDKVLKIYFANNATFFPEGGKESLGLAAFTESRSLFYGEIISYISACDSKMSDPFGVLPIPKYDRSQEKYHSWASPIYCTMMVSRRVDDSARLGALIEGYNIISEKHLRPVYYETVLFRKVIKDEESREMLDYIFKGRIYDFANFNSDWNLLYTFRMCVNKNDNGFASEIQSVSSSAQKKLERLISAIKRRYG